MRRKSKRKMQKSKFKKAFAFLVLIFLSANLSFLPVNAQGETGVLIVKVKSREDAQNLSKLASEIDPLFGNIYRITVPDQAGTENYLSSVPWVEFAEKDAIVKLETNAQDPLFVLDINELAKQWYLPKMQAHLAWEKTIGAGITVAIIDTGIDARHEDLNDGRMVKGYANYCQAPGVKSGDCLIRVTGELAAGVNSDDNGHGTIVAGIIGAISNNNKGIAGIVWNVKLMPVKALDSKGSGVGSDVAVGIKWAVDNGAKIINLSLGGPGLEGNQVIQEAITYAFNKGVLVVAAAGNDAAVTGGDLNKNPSLPVCADGGQNMIIGVAAVNEFDRKAQFSNYGSNCVDISAPGTASFVDRNKAPRKGLVSSYYDTTRPGEQDLYVYASGTSVAAAFVSGAAALVMGVFPDLDVKAFREKLLSSVDNIDDLNGSGCEEKSCVGQIGRGRLNIYKAVTASAATDISTGTLIKNPQGQIYLIEKGLKRVVSAFVFNQRFPGQATASVELNQAESFPNGSALPPVDGTIIKEPIYPTVYLVEGGQRLPLSYLAFVSRGFKFEKVITIESEEMVGYPLGSNASVLDGVLMKSPDHPAVYIMAGGQRQLLSYFTFKERGFDKQPIVSLSLDTLAIYPVNPTVLLYPPPDGRVIKGDVSETVFLVEENMLRAMTLPAFQNRGYSFSQVIILPQSEIEGYERGEDILQ